MRTDWEQQVEPNDKMNQRLPDTHDGDELGFVLMLGDKDGAIDGA